MTTTEYIENYCADITFEDNDVVLDIATGHQLHYKHKLDNAKKLIAIEPDITRYNRLIDHVSDVTCETEILNCTYEDYTPIENIDVVVCAGLLYHLSSPMHFLETVANVYQPKVFYLETTGVYNPDEELKPGLFTAQFRPEAVNIRGNRQGFNIVPYTLTISQYFVVHVMETIGYKLEKYTNLSSTTSGSKNAVTNFKFVRSS